MKRGRVKVSFFEKVYLLLKTIPRGKVTTYGDIARAIGAPKSSRAVGYALHANPDPQNIPCYKVVNREGYLAPSFAFGGEDVQKALLESEGIKVVDHKVDLEKYRHEF
ncbi:MAG: MGMT family protein [Clostridia bacterium]|nr:MGMT family protein [Clostridia bacterium]